MSHKGGTLGRGISPICLLNPPKPPSALKSFETIEEPYYSERKDKYRSRREHCTDILFRRRLSYERPRQDLIRKPRGNLFERKSFHPDQLGRIYRDPIPDTMPERKDITYFGAGPAGLPTDVLQTASEALLNYEQTGLGLAEHSHRSGIATGIVEGTKVDLAKYLDIPSDYEVLFMQGGGSGEFSATVYNLVSVWVERRKQKVLKELGLQEEKELPKEALEKLQQAVDKELKIDYLVTGSWSLKASQEAARLVGSEHVNVAADARTVNEGKFGKIPEESSWKLSKNAAMVYYCDNETVDGVEFPAFPKVLEPNGEDEPIVVADMSSNILSRRIPVKNFSVIFFGAQKNLGSTGITVVIIKKSLLLPPGTPPPSLLRKLGLPNGPIVLDYPTIAKNKSLYNTLSIFE